MKRTLFKNFKVCATCTLWNGIRNVDGTRTTISYDDNKIGECINGGFNHLKKAPLSPACPKYQQWIK